MFRKRSAALPSGKAGVEDYIAKQEETQEYYPQSYKTYWPGALLGVVAGASYPVYYLGKMVLDNHPTRSAFNVLIDQGFIYLVVAAAVVPAFIGSRVFELLLGGIFQKHDRR